MHPDGGRAWVLSFFLLEQPIILTGDDNPGKNWGKATPFSPGSQAIVWAQTWGPAEQ